MKMSSGKNKFRFIVGSAYRFVMKRSPALRSVIRPMRTRTEKAVYDLFYSHDTDRKLIVFMSFLGRGYSDTPKAVYEYMKQGEAYRDFRFVWAFRDPDAHKFMEEDPRTSVVAWRSAAFLKVMSRAGYWISNNRVPVHIWPRKDQTYVQCWHGTPLKRLGHDLEGTTNAINSLKDLLYKYDVDALKLRWFLSPSAYATDRFTSAFDLGGKGKEDAILEIGYPRNDSLVCSTAEDRARKLEGLGVPADKKVVLYAPTWRDDQYSAATGYTYDLGLDFEGLRRALGEGYVILFRVHYFISNSFDFSSFGGYIVDASDIGDINDLYIASDILITDYSSVFFDYADTGKPMVFYMYDLEKYRDEARGFYIGLDELPGEIVTEEAELARAMRDALDAGSYEEKYGEKYAAFKAKYNNLDDGHATERLVKKVIGDGNVDCPPNADPSQSADRSPNADRLQSADRSPNADRLQGADCPPNADRLQGADCPLNAEDEVRE
ncbi:MAG: CDP-glycerol glycerophosphotransferase family protein [Clostridiales Family XIII bacterium]|jgi:CDP-glycerol glycerophosphotransferase|nr:CDP-glycerol glycerophosphotransferase family protein [Clostridiales Family XIII bacterium]